MFSWFQRKPKRPSNYILGSQIASAIDGFLEVGTDADLSSPRLHVVIDRESNVSISEPRHVKDILVAVPLRQLSLSALPAHADARHLAVDIAAHEVLRRLEPVEPNRRGH